jgi:hypothetical protein
MKYFRPKSALVYGSEIAVWATFWATYDTARLVGMRPVVRQIAARGRLCAGAACPVGGEALSGGAMYRLPAVSTLTPAGSVVVTDVAVMLSAALPAVVVVGAVRCCRRP